jgi:pimeloyl-ACP methyl ester carboxylesterase
MPVRSHPVSSTDAVTLAVHDFGGDGPVVLFAHATGFHGMVWSPLIAELGPSFHSVSVDFRGHGDSSGPDHGSFDWSGFADDVFAVIDDLGSPRPLYGVGHSKGGAALLRAEQRAPGTFAALYCFEPIVIGPDARRASAGSIGEHPLATGARRRREVFDSTDDALDNFASKPPLQGLHPDALRAYVSHGFTTLDDGTVRLKCRGVDEAAVYSMSTEHDTFDHLHLVTCPVTVAASGDLEGAGRLARPVADALPHGRYEQHPQLGHFGPLEAPALIAERIRAAFRS